jgi:hypothetical protein
MADTRRWAEDEFGGVQLGDRRRTLRLVRLASEVASRPAGTITRACATSASREGAFRWLENKAVQHRPVAQAVEQATLKRCGRRATVFVPIDATSLTIVDEKKTKDLGAVGAWSQGGRGIHAMTAFAVTADGCPLGICGQRLWVREQRSRLRGSERSSVADDRETRFWLDLLESTQASFTDSAPDCTPWYQLDRGADCWPVLELAQRLDLLLTVRAAHDRRLDGRARLLWSELSRKPIVGHLRVDLPERPPARRRERRRGHRFHWLTPPRSARSARVYLRSATVPITLTTAKGRTFTVKLNAVLAQERGRRDDKLEWMLLTTHPVGSRADVLKVVRGYTFRWRIEELHRAWKRGLCRVEDSQLRSREAFFKWATLLAAVASRAMQLTYRARNDPDAPATDELTRTELEALISLRQPKNVQLDHVPSVGLAVRWLAELGGYTGPWNGPPGPTVVGRGLRDVLAAARAFEQRDKMR